MAAKTQLDRIEGAIFGNGREGLIAITARIEENIEEAKAMSQAVSETTEKTAQVLAETTKQTAAALAKLHEHYNERFDKIDRNIEEMKGSVTAHHQTEHLADIIKVNPGLVVVTDAMKKPRFFANVFTIGAVLFVILHLVSTYLPNVWDWAMLLLGLPKLVIPIG